MRIVQTRSNGWPRWLAVALLLVCIFAAWHGIGGLITGAVLVPRSHGYYANIASDPNAYHLSEAIWLIAAAVSGPVGGALAAKYWLRRQRARVVVNRDA
jgi:hypothetical protein